MEIFNAPSVSISGKSNEENVQALKAWANNVSDTLNFYLSSLQSQIDEMKKEISQLKGE